MVKFGADEATRRERWKFGAGSNDMRRVKRRPGCKEVYRDGGEDASAAGDAFACRRASGCC